eukprot:2040952-Prymnesium_polylepis.1
MSSTAASRGLSSLAHFSAAVRMRAATAESSPPIVTHTAWEASLSKHMSLALRAVCVAST